MLRIDAHQHFWKYHASTHEWINEEMAVIRKDFYPEALVPLLKAHDIDGCMAVQADQTEEETNFLLQLSNEHTFIKGVVGWINLCSENIEDRLQYYKGFTALKGFRFILQDKEPSFMLAPDFIKGISLLGQYGFTYDILVFPHHLAAVLQMVEQCPDQSFVLDHMAKPLIKEKQIEEWRLGIQALAQHKNVFCKLSGLITEADWNYYTEADLKPYIDTIVLAFGIDRIMFGSDWPVCLVAASYARWIKIIEDYFANHTLEEKEKIFGLNAIKFYHLK